MPFDTGKFNVGNLNSYVPKVCMYAGKTKALFLLLFMLLLLLLLLDKTNSIILIFKFYIIKSRLQKNSLHTTEYGICIVVYSRVNV